jgi:hypothetical protein
VYQAIVESGGATAESAGEQLAQAFASSGLAEHGYVGDYLTLARNMVDYFALSREGYKAERPTSLSLTVGKEQITIFPDDVLVRPDGQRTFRRVRTGHKTTSDLTGIGAAAFLLAARRASADAAVEFVYLSDGAVHPVAFTPKQLANGSVKLGASLDGVRAGVFPANPSARVCPSCPAFFICGPTPFGVLRKSF